MQEASCGLPTLDVFPAKIRPHIEHAQTTATEAFSTAQRAVETRQAAQIRQQEDLTELPTEVLSPEQHTKVHQHIQALNQELATLCKAQTKLQHGQDAFNLIVGEDDSTLTALHHTYGDTLSGRVRSFFSRTDYQNGREKYRKQLVHCFNFRLKQFSRRITTPLDISTTAVPHTTLSDDTRMAIFHASLEQGNVAALTSLRQEYEQRVHHTRQAHAGAHLQYTETTKWIEAHQQALSSLRPQDEPSTDSAHTIVTKKPSLLETRLQERTIDLQSMHRLMQTFDTDMTTALMRIVGQMLGRFTHAYQLPAQLYTTEEVWIGDCALSTCGIPQEAQPILTAFIELVSSLAHAHGTTHTAALTEHAQALAGLKATTDLLHTTNERFPESQDTLWHMASVQTMLERILPTGMLASRATQLEQFGETQFSSSTIRSMTKEGITLGTSNANQEFLTWEQFAERRQQQPNATSKDPLQEMHQICFSSNYPYLTDGIALVFNRSSLMSKSQFMSSDGYHLFDPAYRTDKTNSPGFAVDLHTEPMVLVGLRAQETQVREQLEELLTSPEWRAHVDNPQEWVSTHVLFIESFADTQQVTDTAPQLLKQQGLHSLQPGFFVPTGESGESAIRAQRGLYTYSIL